MEWNGILFFCRGEMMIIYENVWKRSDEMSRNGRRSELYLKRFLLYFISAESSASKNAMEPKGKWKNPKIILYFHVDLSTICSARATTHNIQHAR